MSDDTRPYKAGFEAMHERMHGGAAMDIVKRLRETYPATYAFTKIPHIGYEAADEIERLRPDAELCRRIIDELVRQNNGMTPGWLLDMVPNAIELTGAPSPRPSETE